MRSLTSSTRPSRMRTNIAPSPSARVGASVRIVRLRSVLMRLALTAKRRGAGVEGPKHPHEVRVADAVPLQPAAERGGLRVLHRAEAAVAAAVVRRAQRAAARVRDRPEARGAVRD